MKNDRKEEHTPLFIGVEQAISAKKRIQKEYTMHFKKLCEVLKVPWAMITSHNTSPTCTIGEVTSRPPMVQISTSSGDHNAFSIPPMVVRFSDSEMKEYVKGWNQDDLIMV